MDERKRYFRLGLFVSCLSSAWPAILFVLGGRALFQPTFTFETYFDKSVAGLEIGAPVRFRGVPLGQVMEIMPSITAYEPDVPLNKRGTTSSSAPRFPCQRIGSNVSAATPQTLSNAACGLRPSLQGSRVSSISALDVLDPQKYPPLAFDWTPKYRTFPRRRVSQARSSLAFNPSWRA